MFHPLSRFSRSRRRERRAEKRARVLTTFQRQLRDLGTVCKALAAIAFVWTLISFVTYVGHDNGDTTSERVATWARNHHLGKVIDWVETKEFSTPPSKTPASKLFLVAPQANLAGAATAKPSISPTAFQPAVVPAGNTAPAPVVVSGPAPLAPLSIPALFSPALALEGQWSPIAKAGGQDTMWATSLRPLPDAGAVVATVVEIDQTHLRAGLFNGAEEPGGTWNRGNRIPTELQPSLLAAMNGGFRFEHIKGGYKTEGIEVKPLKQGDATLAVGTDGHIALGALGREIRDDGSWISLRQNLILIVDDGKSQVGKGIREGVWWGADYGNKVYVPRSAACVMKDGRIAYVLVGKVEATQLARALINVGCVTAIQLDINGKWPVFFTFGPDGAGSLTGRFVDQRMGGDPNRYLTGSTKEFFAFFDATRLPAKSVLDH